MSANANVQPYNNKGVVENEGETLLTVPDMPALGVVCACLFRKCCVMIEFYYFLQARADLGRSTAVHRA